MSPHDDSRCTKFDSGFIQPGALRDVPNPDGRVYDAVARTLPAHLVQANDLEPLLFRNFGEQLVRLKFHPLQNVVADHDDDFPAGPHARAREGAKAPAVVEVRRSVVRPSSSAIGAFFRIPRPEIFELPG